MIRSSQTQNDHGSALEGELLTAAELKVLLREAVADAGGAKAWLRKHKMIESHIHHMFTNGDAATLPNVLRELGYEPVTMYRKRAAP